MRRGPFSPIFDPPKRKGVISRGVMIGEVPATPLPTSLADLTSLDHANLATPWGLAVYGDYLAVLTVASVGRLTMVDISNPASPSVVGSIQPTLTNSMNAARHVAIYQDYAVCCSGGNSRVVIIDISNPATPTHVGTIEDGTNLVNPYDIVIVGDHAIITDNFGDQITSVDISNPASPTVADVLTDVTIASPLGITVVGDVALVAMESVSQPRVVTVDVSDPTSLAVLGSVSSATNLEGGWDIEAVGDVAYSTAYLDTTLLNSIDFSTPASPALLDSLVDAGRHTGSPSRVALFNHVSGTWAVIGEVITGTDGLSLVDCRDPANLTIVDDLDIASFTCNDMVVYDHYAILSSSAGNDLRFVEIVLS